MTEPSGAPPTGVDQEHDEPRDPAEEETTSTEDAATGSTPADAPPSNLAKLKTAYEAASEDRRETIPIAPGIYAGNLAARYHPIEWSDTRKKMAKLQRKGASDEQALNFAASQLVKACETILVRPDDDSDFVPVHEAVPSLGPEPVRFDTRLCQLLGIDAGANPKATTVARLVFVDPNILDTHFTRFELWLRGEVIGDEEDEPEEEADLSTRPT